jgi:hypothetical protein
MAKNPRTRTFRIPFGVSYAIGLHKVSWGAPGAPWEALGADTIEQRGRLLTLAAASQWQALPQDGWGPIPLYVESEERVAATARLAYRERGLILLGVQPCEDGRSSGLEAARRGVGGQGRCMGGGDAEGHRRSCSSLARHSCCDRLQHDI